MKFGQVFAAFIFNARYKDRMFHPIIHCYTIQFPWTRVLGKNVVFYIFSFLYLDSRSLFISPPPITPCEVKGIDIQQNLKDSFINFDDLYKCSSVGYQLCLARQDPVACVWMGGVSLSGRLFIRNFLWIVTYVRDFLSKFPVRQQDDLHYLKGFITVTKCKSLCDIIQFMQNFIFMCSNVGWLMIKHLFAHSDFKNDKTAGHSA